MAQAQTAQTATAQAPNFSDLLNVPSGQVERPKPYPQGTYQVSVQGLPRFDKSSKKQTPFVELTYNLLGAGEDVDQEALADMGGIQGKTIKDTYYITESARWRIKEMLDAFQVGDAENDTLQARLEMLPGASAFIFVKHEPSQDGTSVFARVDKVITAE